MKYYISYIKDSIGNNYLGIKIPNEVVSIFLEELKKFLSEEEFEIFVENQRKRDNGSYHITLINVMEFNKLSDQLGMDNFVNSLQYVFKYDIDDIKMKGIGMAEKSSNKAFFVVCESDKLNTVREYYNLPEKDLHITIGFKWKDVFGVRKNVVLKKETTFINILKQKYLENNNFDFIKDISNFDLDKNSQIIPVRITDTYIKVKCDNKYIDVSYIDVSNELRVITKYDIEGYGLPRLSTSEINKKLEI